MARIGLATSPLPRECSTTEPHGQANQTGAGEGNRTLVVSLEGFCSTIELHPPGAFPRLSPVILLHPGQQPGNWWRRLDSNQRRRKPTDLQSAPFSHSGTPPGNRELWRCRIDLSTPCAQNVFRTRRRARHPSRMQGPEHYFPAGASALPADERGVHGPPRPSARPPGARSRQRPRSARISSGDSLPSPLVSALSNISSWRCWPA